MELIFEKIFDLITEHLWENLWFWRIFGLSLFFLIVLAFSFKDKIATIIKRDSALDSDKATFLESDKILNEDYFKEYYDTLGTNRMIQWQSRRVSRFIEYFKKTGNQYYNNRLRKRASKLVEKLEELQLFTFTHFFWYPNNQHVENDNYDYIQSALYPELAHDPPDSEGHQMYLQRQKELHAALDQVKPLFKNYRRAIRKTLLV